MLTLHNIGKERQSGGATVRQLAGVDLQIRRNELVAILGPPGSGKTALLRILGGFERPTEGELLLDGAPTDRFSERTWAAYRCRYIGFVSREGGLIPHQTVRANVMLAPRVARMAHLEGKRHTEEALTRTGLVDLAGKKAAELSHEQAQRAAVARALANDPKILLADEPTGTLDAEESARFMEMLQGIATTRPVVIATQNAALAERYAARVIRLQDGRVAQDTAPDRVNVVKPIPEKAERRKWKRIRLPFRTALALGFGHLRTKRLKTFCTSLAGGVGILLAAGMAALAGGLLAVVGAPLRWGAAIALFIAALTVGINMSGSVLERKAETGALLDIGAGPRDIARMFHAETMLLGLGTGIAGIAGALIVYALIQGQLPARLISMPPGQGIGLLASGVGLSWAGGFVPALWAAKNAAVV